MTTAQDILSRARLLLQYDGDDGTGGYRPTIAGEQGLAAVNQIYSDLWFMERDGDFRELTARNQPLSLSPRALNEVMPYGVAMLLAQMEGDGGQQELYASLYNQKRGSIAAGGQRRIDVLPRGCDT